MSRAGSSSGFGGGRSSSGFGGSRSRGSSDSGGPNISTGSSVADGVGGFILGDYWLPILLIIQPFRWLCRHAIGMISLGILIQLFGLYCIVESFYDFELSVFIATIIINFGLGGFLTYKGFIRHYHYKKLPKNITFIIVQDTNKNKVIKTYIKLCKDDLDDTYLYNDTGFKIKFKWVTKYCINTLYEGSISNMPLELLDEFYKIKHRHIKVLENSKRLRRKFGTLAYEDSDEKNKLFK